MRVLLTKSYTEKMPGGGTISYRGGDVYDFPQERALSIIAAGEGSDPDAPPVVETTAPAAEAQIPPPDAPAEATAKKKKG